MKRLIFTVLFGMLATCLLQADEKIITRDVQRLPETSRTFIKKHLGNAAVSHIKIEKGWFGINDYEVILTDGVEVKFDSNGEWEEVEGHQTAISTTFFPAFILRYLKQNFPEASVLSIEKDRRKYEVKLSNHLELKFNMQGELIDIDR